MPASCSSSDLSAHQMALAGAIAHSGAHLCPDASTLSLSSLVSPLRPLGLGLLGRCDPRSFYLLRRYGGRSGQPWSSSLARRACVHSSGCSMLYCMASLVFVPFKFGYWDTVNFASAPGLSGGRGEMAMAVASSARLAYLRGAVCAFSLYIRYCLFGICFPLFPVQRQSNELLATTVGACRRRHSL